MRSTVSPLQLREKDRGCTDSEQELRESVARESFTLPIGTAVPSESAAVRPLPRMSIVPRARRNSVSIFTRCQWLQNCARALCAQRYAAHRHNSSHLSPRISSASQCRRKLQRRCGPAKLFLILHSHSKFAIPWRYRNSGADLHDAMASFSAKALSGFITRSHTAQV